MDGKNGVKLIIITQCAVQIKIRSPFEPVPKAVSADSAANRCKMNGICRRRRVVNAGRRPGDKRRGAELAPLHRRARVSRLGRKAQSADGF